MQNRSIFTSALPVKPTVCLFTNNLCSCRWAPASLRSDLRNYFGRSRSVYLHFSYLILCFSSSCKSVVDGWEKDISVHPLPLPQSSCEELQQLLMSSTSRLPAFLRCMNSYQVTYRSDHTHACTNT